MKEHQLQKKIALVGTGCVGKTSIIEHLKSDHKNDPNVGFIEEAARIYFTQHSEIPVNIRFSYKPQSEIQDLALKLEQDAHDSQAYVLISDRSVLDAAVYVRASGDLVGSRRLVERIRDWLPTYSSIVLLSPKDVPYQQDEVRKEDQIVRQKNHEKYLKLFAEEGITYELLNGSLEDRIRRIEELILL